MALTIDNPETERLVEELARKTGRAPSDVVAEAVREKAERRPMEKQPADPPDIWERIREIQDRVAKTPDADTRSADEIIGYDEYGVPR